MAPFTDPSSSNLVKKEHESYDVLGPHHRICQMVDFQVQSGSQPFAFIALRRYQQDLYVYLRKALPSLSLADRRTLATDLLTQIFEGLGFAITRNVTMNDLKPSNVFVDAIHPRGRMHLPSIRIGDWGLAKVAKEQGIDSSRLGWLSPMWHSPEWVLVKGRTKVTPAADLYSAAAIAYFCISGDPPFWDLVQDQDEQYEDVIVKLRDGLIALAPLPGAGSHPLDTLVMRWLSLDPSERQPGANLELNDRCDLYVLAQEELNDATIPEGADQWA
ncbi:hypothetical protein ACE2AJ_09860 [Aquihabitans daechungensis]|uniref:protein kinase domain-containing protein n=1 Tax=Aquihabitans daechungensis TaxID=1052257 RepID=UPI003B9E4D6F